MSDKKIIDFVLDPLAKFGWWLYVKIAWRRNKPVQRKLNADIRDNLGYTLSDALVRLTELRQSHDEWVTENLRRQLDGTGVIKSNQK